MNTLFAVSGNSGAGKTTLFRSIKGLYEIVSFTTRSPREGELDGVDYHFISADQYQSLEDSGAVIESAMYDGEMYGVTAHEFYTKLSMGDCFMVVEFHGRNTIMQLHPRTVSIFVYNSMDDARMCLKARGDSGDKILSRLSTYDRELRNRRFYDYVVKNPYGRSLGTRRILENIVLNESKNLGKNDLLSSPVSSVADASASVPRLELPTHTDTSTTTTTKGVIMNGTGTTGITGA